VSAAWLAFVQLDADWQTPFSWPCYETLIFIAVLWTFPLERVHVVDRR